MKEYNCPDCKRDDSCNGCPRVPEKNTNTIKEDGIPSLTKFMMDNTVYIPSCCKYCGNHPSNGGSGICNCTLPLYDPNYPYKITY